MLRHGVEDHNKAEIRYSGIAPDSAAEEGKSPVDEIRDEVKWHQSSTGHVKPGVKQGGPPPKAKYYLLTDREQYREGKVKRTPGGE